MPRQKIQKDEGAPRPVRDTIKPALKPVAATPPPTITTPVVPTAAAPEKRSNPMVKIIVGILCGIVIIAILFIVVIGVGIYKFKWHNQLTDTATKILPYPAAMLSSNILRYSSFQADVNTLNFFYSAQAAANPGSFIKPSEAYLQKSVLSRMVREKFITDKAEELALKVTQKEIDDEFSTLVTQAGSVAEVKKSLKELYNWNETQFKAKVLQPYLLRVKLQEYVGTNDTINAAAKQTAEKVLALVKEGKASFEDLAKQYSEDTTASSGGDLGFFSAGQMVKPFEDAVKTLKAGETSGIVKTQYGYHIIKLLEVVAASGDKPEQFHAEHILIKSKDIDTWVNEQLAKQKVTVFLSGYAWKKDCGLVLAKAETCTDNELTTTGTPSADTNANSAPSTNTNEEVSNTNSANTNTANTNQ